jgi:hypothetical protein
VEISGREQWDASKKRRIRILTKKTISSHDDAPHRRDSSTMCKLCGKETRFLDLRLGEEEETMKFVSGGFPAEK